MAWVAVGSAVVGVAGAAISGNAASKSAKGQQEAADRAAALQQSNYQQTREDNLPALEARNNALQQMTQRANAWGSEPTADQVMSTPGYQFGLQEGQNALEGSAAASGGLFSGNVGKALQRYGNDYGTTKYNEAFNRMQSGQNAEFNRFASLGGLGQVGTSQLATTGQNTANAIGSIGTANAVQQGANGIAQANLWGNTASQAGSAMKGIGSGWFTGSGSTGGGTLSGQYDPGGDGGYADYWGGADGGPVHGPGTARSDSIHAKLSDGEHVFDATSVNALGNGDNELGQLRLNKLRAMLQGRGT